MPEIIGIDTASNRIYSPDMSKQTINKKAIDGIAEISKAILEGPTGQAVLRINNGGLRNKDGALRDKDVRRWTNELFKADVLPFLCKRGESPIIITGQLVCNISDGALTSLSHRNWYLHKQEDEKTIRS